MEASDPTSRTTTMSKRSGEFELVLNLKTAKALGLDVSSPGSPMRSLNKCGEARCRSSGCKSRRHRCMGRAARTMAPSSLQRINGAPQLRERVEKPDLVISRQS
jgi:hypothetical protein